MVSASKLPTLSPEFPPGCDAVLEEASGSIPLPRLAPRINIPRISGRLKLPPEPEVFPHAVPIALKRAPYLAAFTSLPSQSNQPAGILEVSPPQAIIVPAGIPELDRAEGFHTL